MYEGNSIAPQAKEVLQEDVYAASEELKLLSAGIEEVEKGTPGYCSAPLNNEHLERKTREFLKKKFLSDFISALDKEKIW